MIWRACANSAWVTSASSTGSIPRKNSFASTASNTAPKSIANSDLRRRFKSWKREAAPKFADAHDAQTNDLALGIQSFHHSVVVDFRHVPGGIREPDFEEISFGIEPDFYFVGHKSSPALGLSVR